MKMDKNEVVYMLGYLTHIQIIDAVTTESVSASSMIDICEHMNKHYWGGYEGCIRYCEFFQEDKELTKLYESNWEQAKVFKERYMHDGHLGDFCPDVIIYNGTEDVKDTEENFRKEYAKKKLGD